MKLPPSLPVTTDENDEHVLMNTGYDTIPARRAPHDGRFDNEFVVEKFEARPGMHDTRVVENGKPPRFPCNNSPDDFVLAELKRQDQSFRRRSHDRETGPYDEHRRDPPADETTSSGTPLTQGPTLQAKNEELRKMLVEAQELLIKRNERLADLEMEIQVMKEHSESSGRSSGAQLMMEHSESSRLSRDYSSHGSSRPESQPPATPAIGMWAASLKKDVPKGPPKVISMEGTGEEPSDEVSEIDAESHMEQKVAPPTRDVMAKVSPAPFNVEMKISTEDTDRKQQTSTQNSGIRDASQRSIGVIHDHTENVRPDETSRKQQSSVPHPGSRDASKQRLVDVIQDQTEGKRLEDRNRKQLNAVPYFSSRNKSHDRIDNIQDRAENTRLKDSRREQHSLAPHFNRRRDTSQRRIDVVRDQTEGKRLDDTSKKRQSSVPHFSSRNVSRQRIDAIHDRTEKMRLEDSRREQQSLAPAPHSSSRNASQRRIDVVAQDHIEGKRLEKDPPLVLEPSPEGFCRTCGTKVCEVRSGGLFRGRSMRHLVPLDVPGVVKSGQCLYCHPELVNTAEQRGGIVPGLHRIRRSSPVPCTKPPLSPADPAQTRNRVKRLRKADVDSELYDLIVPNAGRLDGIMISLETSSPEVILRKRLQAQAPSPHGVPNRSSIASF